MNSAPPDSRDAASPHDNRPVHVVVLGGGFGGLEFCTALRDPSVRITLIDRQNHHLFQPLLYQVATAGLSAPEIAQPLRAILADRTDIVTLMDEVTGIDLDARTVTTRRERLHYDYLVIALGAVTGYFGHREWEKFAPGLKTLDDATAIRRRLLLAFEEAEASSDPDEIARLTTIAVVGGGPTGVELAGSIAELTRRVLPRGFRRIDPAKTRIILIEALPRVLAMFPEELSRYTEDRLRGMGVTVLTSAPVKEVGSKFIRLENETIRAATIIWAAGVDANPITRSLDAKLDRKGRIEVSGDLSIPDHPEAFAIGDIARVVDRDGREVPGVSPAAMQMGRHVARLIASEVRLRGRTGGEDIAPLVRGDFAYRDKGMMATIGRSAAVAMVGGRRMSGFIAWLAWLGVHIVFLIGFRNRIAVLIQWFYSYVRFKRGARIISGQDAEAAPSDDHTDSGTTNGSR